ncbi:hypothetical protein SAMN05444339_101151 [Loktanella atrilutea]|uniref:TIGR04255 family protein n=1 Tax=Loktanella atrilutea TaxID=366533 RepID=A0A1M4SV36_LOKAT|nr:hypothetical protein [Loktanella atrilutea]SHE36079.1 hypothetical protein SAMN05444339_101151 [Loktanella atrilutea]
MQIEPEISGVSIVLIGNFNPAIFHPSWLMANGIEPEVDTDRIDLEVCHKDVSRFSIDGTHYFVDQDRFQIQTSSAPWVQILDKTTNLFRGLLPHTPLKAVGLNRDAHFVLPSFEARMKLGRKIAPIEPWGKFGGEMEKDEPELAGGMLSLTMRSTEAADDYSLNKNLKIEPSFQVKGSNGVYIQANFHFTPKDADATSIDLVGLLQGEFQDRINEAEEIFATLLGGK